MDVGALWFADNEGKSNTSKLLKGGLHAINMNGSSPFYENGILSDAKQLNWSSYSSPESTAQTTLNAGQSLRLSAEGLGSPPAYLGIRAFDTTAAEGDIKWAASYTRNNDHTAPSRLANGSSYLFVGTGITADNFTVSQEGNLQLGLQARSTYTAGGPTNETFSNGDGTYGGDNGYDLTKATVPGGLAVWNFDFSVNTRSGGGTSNINQYYYQLSLDHDPTTERQFVAFDPITGLISSQPDALPGPDHVVVSEDGIVQYSGADSASYREAIATNPILQQSWNYGFFTSFFPELGNALLTPGVYTVQLAAYKDTNGNYNGLNPDSSELVNLVEIDVTQLLYS